MTETEKQQVQVLQQKLQEAEDRLDSFKKELVAREQHLKAALEAREAEFKKERTQWEAELNHRVAKFVEEREQWLRTLKTRESDIQRLQAELAEKDQAVHAVLQDKEKGLREAMARLETEVRDRERRIFVEKESLTKQFETQSSTRESHHRSALEKKEAELKEVREQHRRELLEARQGFDAERKGWDARLAAKDEELVRARSEEAQKLGELQAVWHRRFEESQSELEAARQQVKAAEREAVHQRELAAREAEARLESKAWEGAQALAAREAEYKVREERGTAERRHLEQAFAEERARWVHEREREFERIRQEAEAAFRNELKAAMDRKDRERDDLVLVSDQRLKEAERRAWEERERLKQWYESETASARLSAMEEVKKKEEDLLLAKERYELHVKELGLKLEADRKAWLEQLKRKEDDLAAVKAASLMELREARGRLEARETEFLAQLKQETEAAAARKEAEFQKIVESLKREREQLIALYEDRLKRREEEWQGALEAERRKASDLEDRLRVDVKSYAAKLDEERHTSLELLQAKEQELLGLKGELVTKITQHRRQMEEKDATLLELQVKVESEGKEREKRIWEERDAVTKQFEGRLAKRETELKTLLRERETALQEAQERFHQELRTLARRLEEEREQWHDASKGRDREHAQGREELLKRVAELQASLERREAELAAARDRGEDAKREAVKALKAELDARAKEAQGLEDQVSRLRVDMALRESQTKALLEKKDLEGKALKDQAEREVRLLQKRFDAEKSGWIKALKSREQEGDAAKRELYIRQLLSS